MHMNLLRQKITQLQQEKQAHTALALERDEAHLAVRKLEKKVERMQKELSACREHNTELKAKLADTNELKASVWLLSLFSFCQCTPKCTLRNGTLESGVAVRACNTSTWEVDASRSGVQSHSCYTDNSRPAWVICIFLKQKRKKGGAAEMAQCVKSRSEVV